MRQTFFFGIVVCIIISCTSRNKKQPVGISPVKKIEKNLSITSIGVAEFIRSFSFLQSSTLSQKEIDKLYKETENSNPIFQHNFYIKDSADKMLKRHFEVLGLVQGNELLLSEFKYISNPDTSIINSKGEKINIQVYRDTVGWGDHDKVTIYNGRDSASAATTIYFGLKYALLDVVPGGNKELVVLNEHYLMNTEFYYLEVFEIKNKD